MGPSDIGHLCGGWDFPLSRTEMLHRALMCYEKESRLSVECEFLLVNRINELETQVQELGGPFPTDVHESQPAIEQARGTDTSCEQQARHPQGEEGWHSDTPSDAFLDVDSESLAFRLVSSDVGERADRDRDRLADVQIDLQSLVFDLEESDIQEKLYTAEEAVGDPEEAAWQKAYWLHVEEQYLEAAEQARIYAFAWAQYARDPNNLLTWEQAYQHVGYCNWKWVKRTSAEQGEAAQSPSSQAVEQVQQRRTNESAAADEDMREPRASVAVDTPSGNAPGHARISPAKGKGGTKGGRKGKHKPQYGKGYHPRADGDVSPESAYAPAQAVNTEQTKGSPTSGSAQACAVGQGKGRAASSRTQAFAVGVQALFDAAEASGSGSSGQNAAGQGAASSNDWNLWQGRNNRRGGKGARSGGGGGGGKKGGGKKGGGKRQ